MKEECKTQGKQKATAIELGFSRAWTSIRDSNISTLYYKVLFYMDLEQEWLRDLHWFGNRVLVSMFSAVVCN